MSDDVKGKILLVDDTPANIQVLNAVLGGEHDIYFATSGHDALSMALEEQPDLILLDVMMPDMDGYEVCRRLKADERTREIPVIFVTAMSESQDEERGLKLGAIDYITKPVRPPIVRARVRNHLELKWNRDRLRDLANIDGMTGIANRRRFDETLAREWRRCARSGQPLSMIMIDVDFFKRYNDRYGHLEGDECLRQVARVIQEKMRRGGDLAARYGGEEFVCVLPEVDGEGAARIAQQLRSEVEALAILHEGSEVSSSVTISLGVAVAEPEGNSVPIEALVDRADRALYAAKQNGRNRVEVL